MNNLNLKQTCLLELSGELSPAARRRFLDSISHDPAACMEYETLRGQYSLLSLLPIPEPSAEERQVIPARIKAAIHEVLLRPVNKARKARLLIRYAIIAAFLAAASAVYAGLWASNQAESRRHLDQFARITAATERVTATTKASPYELAVTDVEASIRQLQTESPTLSNVYDKNLANLLDALASVPQVYDGDKAYDEGSEGVPN